ncbi:hypothetical protein J6590_078888 [Homalodisca vitripennis]|nr:hypothetical protein J6590_078888 [Homalodisca vitripennis]
MFSIGSEGSRCLSSPGSSELFDSKTGKRIVEKLRSDVKGLKNVLRKSRRGTRSKEECMELQPLTNSQDGERYCREGKGILCRMPRVTSEDTSQEDEPYTQDTKIAAGFPLLNRLKLLKEKQEKETVPTDKNKPATKTERPAPKEEEHEVIGQGLPLLQRLLLLKQKEDAERDAAAMQTTANETAQVLASTVRTQLRSPPLSLKSQKSKDKSKEEEQQPLKPIILNRVSAPKKTKDPSATGKNGGVSWKDDCESRKKEPKPVDGNEQNGAACVSEEKTATQEQKKTPPKVKPQLKLQALLKQKGMGVKRDKVEQPTTKSAAATSGSSIKSDPSDNGSLQDQLHDKISRVSSAPEASKTSTNKPENKVLCRVKSCDSPSSFKPLPALPDGEMPKIKTQSRNSLVSPDNSRVENLPSVLSKEVKCSVKSNKFAQEIKSAQTSSVSKDNNNPQTSSNKDSVLINIETSSDDCSVVSCRTRSLRKKPNSLRFKKENKIYRSIEDLSPEYSGLPFVKQLRILNERQKLGELEDKAFMRSSSLDSGHSSENRRFNQMYDSSNLTRSHSEAIAIEVVLRNQYLRAQASAAQMSDYMRTSSGQSTSPDNQLMSPESNETVERRHLKSILKKLSSSSLATSDNADSPERQQFFSSSSAELKKLMRAQTVEGYAARHSKLTKSVTFNRDTLQSPPSGLTSPTTSTSKPVFQYSKISSSLETPSSEKLTTRASSSLDAPCNNKDFTLTNAVANDSENLNTSTDKRYSETPVICLEAQPRIATSSLNSIPLSSESVVSNQPSINFTTETVSTALSQISELRTISCAKSDTRDARLVEHPLRPQVPANFIKSEHPIETPQSKQKNFFRPGSILLPTHASQEEEFFAGILGGIKIIIQNHLVSKLTLD